MLVMDMHKKENRETKLSTYLRKLRKDKGGKGYWSIRSVALRANINNSYLSQLETGIAKKPSNEVLKKLAEIYQCSYEDLMQLAGYLPEKHETPQTIDIPLVGECPASKFNFAYVYENVKDFVVLNYEPKLKDCIAIRVSGDCLKDIGIFDKDIVVVSPRPEYKNGDVVIARVGDECTMKKYYKSDEGQVILQPCNHDYKPIIINQQKHPGVEIIGKIIKALKNFE